MLTRLLHRNLRMTDHKATLGPDKYGILLVDTSEAGGRSAADRLIQLADRHQLQLDVDLRVHDPAGFDPHHNEPRSSGQVGSDPEDRDPDEFDQDGGDDLGNGHRRREDLAADRWKRVDGGVHVMVEDPLVPRPWLRMVVKRSIDIVGASVGLVVTGPIVLAAMAAIRRHDGGPTIFRQTREGLRGRPFTIYKLRTMVVGAEAAQAELRSQSHRDGPAFKLLDDPRVTPVGQFLRRSCIDELPQLWNVLKGEMSLVGPRPLPWHESRACDGWQRRRLEVRPGMTCDWQIEKSKVESFDDWMRLDLRYIDDIGLIRDLRLIARTFIVPVSGRGSE